MGEDFKSSISGSSLDLENSVHATPAPILPKKNVTYSTKILC